MKKNLIVYTLLIVMGSLLVSCSKNRTKFGPFKVVDDQTVMMNGTINRYSLKRFNKMVDKYPNIKIIKIEECPGSTNDEVNLKLSKKVHDLGINIHLLDNGEIASGGVDFFLAGKQRTIGSNVKIGVHSWSGLSKKATDYPVGHQEHQPYIDYYKYVGFSDQEAKDFYYFTINAAGPKDVHWMTLEEIENYKLVKEK